MARPLGSKDKGDRSDKELGLVTTRGIVGENKNAKIIEPEDFQELDEILYKESVSTSGILDKYPDLRKMSKLNQLILAGSAMGMGIQAIGRAVGMDKSSISRRLAKLDPEKMIRMTPEGKKAFSESVVKSKTLDALLAITTDKMEESSARDLSAIAKNLTSISNASKAQKFSGATMGQLDNLMGEIETEQLAVADVIEENVDDSQRRK